ncbi:MAG: glycosyltransferase [Candidatus Brocadia sp.]|nr:glycosyltransferase [Candidatus Brocadia sp.]
MKILFIGDLNTYGRAFQRYRALLDLGYEVTGLSFMPFGFYPGITGDLVCFETKLIKIFFNKLGYPLDSLNINLRTLELMKYFHFDLVWVEKALMLKPNTILELKKLKPGVKVAFYSEDDMYAKHNQSKYFIKCLPLYDLVFTTKSYNCNLEELPSLGAQKVVFVDKAYDKYTHRHLEITGEGKGILGADVGFVGTYERDRAEKMLFLAGKGIPIRIWGNGWNGWVNKYKNLIVENIPIYGDDYVKSICATKINLCFLRKASRDLQTDRTMEIPACGGFMLAERTSEHLRLFEEGKEADLFDINKPEELLEKVKYYLEYENERLAIAKAGRERCLKSKYSHHDRLKYMLEYFEKIVTISMDSTII